MEEKKQIPNITDTMQFLQDLDGGAFIDAIGAALSSVALGVANHGKPGKVQLTFEMKRIGEMAQVTVDHSLSFVRPTGHGKKGEEITKQTPMHVAIGGKLSLFMPQQHEMFPRQTVIESERV